MNQTSATDSAAAPILNTSHAGPAGASAGGPCSAGHLIVRQLEAEGIERIYCVPGESYLDVLDGLHDSPIRTVVCRQEGGAGYMAVAEGRMTGRPGIAMVTRGPGAANVMVAAHTAYQDATPLVIFVGLIPTEVRGREAFQEFDLRAWFGSTAKKVLVLDNPHAAAEMVADALHTAVSGRPGPVVVGLPEETQLVETAGLTVLPRPVAEPGPAPEDLAYIDAAIAQAERPLLVVGGEMWDEEASRAVATWAAGRGLGIVADFRAYDGIDHDAQNFLGALGFGCAPITREVLGAADLQIFLGCARTDVLTNSYENGCAPRQTILINRDPNGHGHYGPLDRLVVSTTKEFGRAVSNLAPIAEALPGWVTEARAEFSAWRVPPAPDESVNPAYVDMDAAFGAIREQLPEDAIITYGAGNHTGWALRYLPVHRFPSALGPRNGSMGFGVPAAVAAGFVHPERKVFSISGDGDFMMNGQEFSTAVTAGLDLTIVINDNSVFGTIVGHQERDYPGRPSGTRLGNPDFAQWARSFGAFGVRVERTEDFAAAFAEALAHPGPAIVHALTDPEVRFTRPAPAD
ncbi:thiamine pyrophosphate-binding protein [Brevibacterium daeguense]|uniref:Thiamine pyrophosphate-binding protein n=1 Tax=Brevibacterium daeguense TaxID=909936 RepID=A0ABP8EGV6_9MICO|nr:thiamine pyrophosphate-dependent enzyme [Brevibacterium daeguense]